MAKKQKIVTEILELLQNGKSRQEILAINGESWRLPARTFDRYLADANKSHLQTQQQIQKVLADNLTDEVVEAAKSGLKSDLEIELQLCKIAFAEIEIEETTYSAQFGYSKFKRKPTPGEMTAAIRELWKKRGVYAAEKIDANVSNEFKVTLNLK